MKAKAAVVRAKGEPFVIEEIELGAPKIGEVLVKVVASGICHTDEVVRQGIIPVEFPAVLGHEGSGIVLEVGPGVTDFKPGDRVSFSYGYCGTCPACRTGKPYGCREMRRLNFGGQQFDGTKRMTYKGKGVSTIFGQGSFATHAVIHQNNLIHVPDDVDLALVAPLGCGLQTGSGAILNFLNPEPGASLLVTGMGAVGYSAIMAAKIKGISTIIACTRTDSKLEQAMHFGATHTINPKKVDSVIDEVHRITGDGVTYAIDCTGNGESVRRSLCCTAPLGKCIILGATQEVTFHCENELMGQGKQLIGIVEGCSVPQVFIPELINYYKQGKFPFDELVAYYDFEDINQAMSDALSSKVGKAIIRMPE